MSWKTVNNVAKTSVLRQAIERGLVEDALGLLKRYADSREAALKLSSKVAGLSLQTARRLVDLASESMRAGALLSGSIHVQSADLGAIQIAPWIPPGEYEAEIIVTFSRGDNEPVEARTVYWKGRSLPEQGELADFVSDQIDGLLSDSPPSQGYSFSGWYVSWILGGL